MNGDSTTFGASLYDARQEIHRQVMSIAETGRTTDVKGQIIVPSDVTAESLREAWKSQGAGSYSHDQITSKYTNLTITDALSAMLTHSMWTSLTSLTWTSFHELRRLKLSKSKVRGVEDDNLRNLISQIEDWADDLDGQPGTTIISRFAEMHECSIEERAKSIQKSPNWLTCSRLE